MNGFLNIRKPVGMSSAAVVGVLKRLTGEKRIGHAGTLDPEAAGVLPVMLGRATRLFDYLVDKEKEYEAVCAFGTATDTQDATGNVTERGEGWPDAERIREMLPRLTGDILQKPSMYSAIKVGGRHLYDLARAGKAAEVPERMVHVERIELTGEETDHGFRLRIVCGKGTYIRSICHDLGQLCGCPAHMRSLVRTRSGFFRLEEGLTLEEARELAAAGTLAERLTPMDAPLGHLRRMQAPGWMAKWVNAGARMPLEKMQGDAPPEGGITRVYLGDSFRGIAQRQGEELAWRMQIPPEAFPAPEENPRDGAAEETEEQGERNATDPDRDPDGAESHCPGDL